MKNFLKKIILPTVDTIVAIEDVPEVGEARPEEFATVEALIGFAKNDQKQRGLKLNDNILIQVCYISILKTISIIDLTTPPSKFSILFQPTQRIYPHNLLQDYLPSHYYYFNTFILF